MTDSLAGVVLGAGAGERLRPLTRIRPKVLCPVGNVPLVDLALARFDGVIGDLAVNVHHGREQLEEHLLGRVHVSVEAERPLGTAGALGALREWIDGRPVLVVNGDSWCPSSVQVLVDGWDGERVRLLVVGRDESDELGPRHQIAGALMPWAAVAGLTPEPSGLYELTWAPAAEDGTLEVVSYDGPFVDCGTPARYLEANLAASGGESVIAPNATVEGEVVRSVVWPDARVRRSERLVDAIRAGTVTVLVR
jgi:MurNAc alpha-1-phosphate uridylyltransferase